ncbi:MAG: alcohol dehydrogenase catalytic domain-containing protein [Desulfomonile tiedjei]|uniref:Alcohol dehydrogenase catalytic domain-containing protein n=1 Tax=Desulfomonile tiedjei TaxID=2358 RepID=A0A9D6V419_9BACT|nr:alcohol dehydrogenase catalytic domain-containing protein [Desulfomonile tiedjei]
MRSVLLKEIGLLAMEDIPVPEPGPGQVLLRVSRCALCRTDAKMWSQGQRDLILPRVLGHEICGIREGTDERFVVWPGEACGRCVQCVGRAENLCEEMKILGFNRDGGLAEKVLVPESSLISVPAALADDAACLAEPLACAFNALEQANLSAGHTLLILGGGAVGLLIALAAKTAGACPFIVEISPEKLSKSEAFRNRLDIRAGASCDYGSFDVAVNACSADDTLLAGISRLKSSGCFCFFSGFTGEKPFPVKALNEIHYRQLRVVGAYGCTRAQMARSLPVLDEFQKEVRLLIEQEIRLGETAQGLSTVLAGEVLKIVVNMEA